MRRGGVKALGGVGSLGRSAPSDARVKLGSCAEPGAFAGYFACVGMPMPSGLLQLTAEPVAPGVGMYST